MDYKSQFLITSSSKFSVQFVVFPLYLNIEQQSSVKNLVFTLYREHLLCHTSVFPLLVFLCSTSLSAVRWISSWKQLIKATQWRSSICCRLGTTHGSAVVV